MKTSTIEVGELVSTLSAAGVHRQLSTLPGVHHADVNYVAGSATVHYDEAPVALDAIRQRVVDCGYHCRGELAPARVCAVCAVAGVSRMGITGRPVVSGFANMGGREFTAAVEAAIDDTLPDGIQRDHRFVVVHGRAAPRANMTCATYPREISEQRGRYDYQPAVEGSDARSEEFFRSGRIARSP